MKYKYLILSLTFAVPITAGAQSDSIMSGRITTASYMLGVGGTRVLDTYLSQEHFSGVGLSYLASVQRQKQGKNWNILMEHQANLSAIHDRSEDTKEIQGDYTFFYGRLRRWLLLGNRFQIEAGGMAVANIGFIYNTSNGNNPAQARVSLNIMPTATATYRFNLWNKNMALRYETQLPLVGIMFSPNYGQSYYEIFSEGNYDHNVVPTTFISAPTMRHMITADVNISKRFTLRVGYLGDLQQSSVNNLKAHIYSNRFMIGVVKQFRLINYRP